MRDYTFEIIDESNFFEERAKFILNYDIYRDLGIIKVYHANGWCETLEYNLINEQKVLQQMKKQVLEYKDVMLKSKEKYVDDNKYDSINKLYLTEVALGCALLLVEGIPIKIFGGFFFLLGSYCTWLEVFSKYSNEKDIDDFEKNMLFLENEELIKEAINSNNDIVLDMPIRILKALTANANGQIEFNLNSISRLKYSDVLKMIKIINNNKDDKNNEPKIMRLAKK